MDVTTPDQAKIAEDSGAVAVMALEKIPADICRDGGVARMANPELIQQIQKNRFYPGYGKVSYRSFHRSTYFRIPVC